MVYMALKRCPGRVQIIKSSLKAALIILTIVWCFPTVGFALSGKDEFQALISGADATAATQLYTAYNLFTEKGTVHAINFQVGTVIPAGTPVKIEFVDSTHAKFIRIKFQLFRTTEHTV
jgi:hypothetical protein